MNDVFTVVERREIEYVKAQAAKLIQIHSDLAERVERLLMLPRIPETPEGREQLAMQEAEARRRHEVIVEQGRELARARSRRAAVGLPVDASDRLLESKEKLHAEVRAKARQTGKTFNELYPEMLAEWRVNHKREVAAQRAGKGAKR